MMIQIMKCHGCEQLYFFFICTVSIAHSTRHQSQEGAETWKNTSFICHVEGGHGYNYTSRRDEPKHDIYCICVLIVQ